ncbi:MAG: hypothetical protein JOZ81_11830 [Chloroflexi bacterium]|nr:hypothetical protein [Chloroflexota bacterium]MBV9544714.1 hypothetical protein [Chloroflexota bacterium]
MAVGAAGGVGVRSTVAVRVAVALGIADGDAKGTVGVSVGVGVALRVSGVVDGGWVVRYGPVKLGLLDTKHGRLRHPQRAKPTHPSTRTDA